MSATHANVSPALADAAAIAPLAVVRKEPMAIFLAIA
jgi:hypothetical protein